MKRELRKQLNAHMLRVKFSLKNGKIYIKGTAYTKQGKIPIHVIGESIGYGKVKFTKVKE